jgi:hypothetical protein
MASPEPSGRVAVPPRNGGGVKNLLAMFEKGAAASSSAPPSPKTPPVNRDISPAPKPLGRVRTSFVAVNSKDGTGIGLQKLPVSPSSPAAGDSNTLGSPFGPALVSDTKPQDTSDPVKKQEEAPAQVEEQKTEDPAAPGEEATADIAKEEPAVETPSENVPPKVTKAEAKPATKEQGKKVAPKKEPAKKEPIKKEVPSKPEASSSKMQTKPAPTSKPAKATVPRNLSVPPTSRSKVPSPLPSPTRKAPAHSRTASKDSIAKPKTKPMASKPPTKPQEPILGVAPKSKATIVHKPIPKPDAKGATKPVELKGTASAPTASWVAKMGGAPAEAAPRRPPSSASMNRTSRSTDRAHTLRRQKSLISDQKEHVRQPRPTTSAAHHIASAPSSDFLSRMMRPTKSSASKVTEKVETTKYQPALRAGSSMGSHGEPHSPPRVKKTASPNRISREVSKPNSEPHSGSEAASPTRKTHFASDSEPESIPEETEEGAPAPLQAPVEEESLPQEEQIEAVVEKQEEQVETEVEEQKDVVEPEAQEVTSVEAQPEVAAVERKTPELTISIEDTPKDNGEEVHTPTTTSSSATLVHEGDSPEDPKEES